MRAFLNKGDYLNIFFLVIANILLTDLLKSDVLKSILSFLPFLILVYIYIFKKKSVFYKVFIVYLFAFPFSPRDIVLVQQGESLSNFISFINFNVGFLSLSLFSIIFFTLIEVLNLGLAKKMIELFIVYLLPFTCYSIFMNVTDFHLNFFISDFKPFLIFFFGYFFGLCIYKRFKTNWNVIFLKIIYILLIVFFVKTIFYIVYDLFISSYNTSFSTLGYLFIPVLFAFFYTEKTKNKTLIILMALVSSFNLSRGFFLMLGVFYMLLPLFYSNKSNVKKILSSYFVLTTLLFLFFSFSKLFLSDEISLFLEYKLDFFTEELFSENIELNRSSTIRVFEFKNILFEIMNTPLQLFLGKGMGGYFEFKEYISPIPIDVDAFSQNQVTLNKYFRPHTFFNMSLLKGGMFLFLIFSYTNIKVFFYSVKLHKQKVNSIFVVFSGVFCLLYLFFYWIPEFLFLNGLIISYVKKHKKNNVL